MINFNPLNFYLLKIITVKTSFYKCSLLFFVFLISLNFHAQETQIMVRAKAKDAKFIGTSIGGAKIIIEDAVSGEILAQGMTSGTTGNTEIIMKKPHERGVPLSDYETAGFLAKLNLQEPKLLTITAHAPFQARQASVLTSTQVWAIPGKDILGDGIVLEVPGFIVDILSPYRHQTINSKTTVEIKANIVMMCGCPITKGGLWNADDYEIKALISQEEKPVKEIELEFSGETNIFKTETQLKTGLYTLTVFAYDAYTGNTGVDKINIIIN